MAQRMTGGAFADPRAEHGLLVGAGYGAFVKMEADPLPGPRIRTDCRRGKHELPAEFAAGGRG